MTTLQERMSENVRLITTARAMSTGDLAAAMGIARTSVVSKMFGRVRWNLDDLERAAAALDVEPAMLVSSLALSVVTEQTRDAASATPLVSVRPKGLEPPTFWLAVRVLWALLAWVSPPALARRQRGWLCNPVSQPERWGLDSHSGMDQAQAASHASVVDWVLGA